MRMLVPLVAAIAAVSTVATLHSLPAFVAAGRIRRRFQPRSTADATSAMSAVTRPGLPFRSIGPFRRSVMQRRRLVADRRVPELLDRVVRQLRSGATMTFALQRVGTASEDPDARRLADELRRGRPLPSAIDTWRSDSPLPNRRLASVALELASVSGGASARVLDGVAESLRDRVALEREVSALSSQARASAVVLVLAPFAFSIFAAAIDPRILGVLASPIGVVCIGIGVLLDLCGAWWMSRLIGRPR